MKIIIEFDTDNAAFEGFEEGDLTEVKRIFRKGASFVEILLDSGAESATRSLRDYNGNTVGHVSVDRGDSR